MKKLLFLLSFCLIATNAYTQDTSIFPADSSIPFLGLDDTSDPLMAKDGRASDMENITLELDGTAHKRYGYSLKNETLDTSDTSDSFEPVTGLYELSKSDGTKKLIAVCGSKIFYDNSGTWTKIPSVTITEGQDYQFTWATALDYAIGTNNQDAPIQWGGTGSCGGIGWGSLSYPITKAKCVTWWKNYLVFGNTTEGGTSHTTRIRWSNVGTIDAWSDDDFVDIATLGGQKIEGFGQLYDNLIIFLTDSIYKVSLVGGEDLINVSKVSEGIGCIAKNSIQNILINNIETLVFLSKDGTIYQYDGTRITELSLLIHGTLDTIKVSRLPYAVSADNQDTSHYYLSITNTDAATTNNSLLDYYYQSGEWSKHTGITANAMCVADDSDSMPQIYFGNYKSFVYQLDNSNKNDDVYGFEGFFDGKSTIDTSTASGLDVLYDTTLSFYDVLLMHNDGIDGSIFFTDEAEHTITANDNTQIDTSQSKFGGASGLLDGNGDYLTLADSADWDWSAADYLTIDMWINLSSLDNGSYATLMSSFNNVNNYWYIAILNSAGTYKLYWVDLVAGANNINFNKTLTTSPIGAWTHIALVKNGTSYMMFQDGTQIGTTETIATYSSYFSGKPLEIGRDGETGGISYFNGWMDEPRISKGIARWTSDFTPSSSAYNNSFLKKIAKGSTLKIISGTGKDEERIVCDLTISGIVVTNSTTATINSEYTLGKIKAYYTTKWYNFGTMKRKNFKDLFLWTTKKNTETMSIYYGDDENSTIENLNLNDYDNDSLWGTKIVSGTTVTWSGEELSISKLPFNVSGRYIKTKFEETSIGSTMDLHSYMYTYDDLNVY